LSFCAPLRKSNAAAGAAGEKGTRLPAAGCHSVARTVKALAHASKQREQGVFHPG
jgi:hypothetical protein